MSSSSRPKSRKATRGAGDHAAASWYCAILLVVLIFLALVDEISSTTTTTTDETTVRGNRFMERPCEEIYIVAEGETLHTISDKCGDPFIVEENPHIQDPDDVFPGLVIKITPFIRPRKLL
ncbi:hypothetical protein Vadar_010546 [Vaccinium darrowii]|uniref:Uncharacterized protein n=1 Tax=Vaccinium darrowii TaxID=229202 RepID=A0ACB7XGK8_9ERIC|nr:hypothetical protein Vadar_010546 [Vaccinium darrowii]